MTGNLGPDYLEASIQVQPNSYVIDGRLNDMPFHQTIEWNLSR